MLHPFFFFDVIFKGHGLSPTTEGENLQYSVASLPGILQIHVLIWHVIVIT